MLEECLGEMSSGSRKGDDYGAMIPREHPKVSWSLITTYIKRKAS